MFKLLASAAALAAATLTTASAAPTPRSVEVHYDDLNLETASGQARLELRIDRAVREVCGVTTGLRPLSQRSAEQACAREAREKAALEVATLLSRDTRLGG